MTGVRIGHRCRHLNRHPASIRAAAIAAAPASLASRPSSSLWYGLALLLLLGLAQMYYLTPAGRADSLQRVQGAGEERRRSPRSRSATRSIRGTLKQPAAATPSVEAVHDDARRGSEAHRGARSHGVQVHRRDGQPLAARAARLDHPAALLRRASGASSSAAWAAPKAA